MEKVLLLEGALTFHSIDEIILVGSDKGTTQKELDVLFTYKYHVARLLLTRYMDLKMK